MIKKIYYKLRTERKKWEKAKYFKWASEHIDDRQNEDSPVMLIGGGGI